MNGSVATYAATVQMPLLFNQLFPVNGFGSLNISGTGVLQVTGSFQFDFGPRTVNWSATSGDFNLAGNWDAGFLPRSGDTASISNGGTASVLSPLVNCPAAYIAVGNAGAGTLCITNTGSLSCNGLILGPNAGSGTVILSGGLATAFIIGGGNSTLNFNGGILIATTSNSSFMQGLTAANLLAGGALIDANGFQVTIAQPLQGRRRPG